MPKRGNISALYDLAASQWGLVTSAQAIELGVSRTQISRMAGDGRLEPVCYGVYRATSGAETTHVAIKAAWLSLRPRETAYNRLGKRPLDAVATGRTAASLYGYGDLHATPYCFATPSPKRTARADLELLHAKVDKKDITLSFDVPAATPERTVADMIRTHEDPSLIDGFIVDAAKKGHTFDADRLAELLSPLSKTQGFSSGVEFARDLISRNAAPMTARYVAQQLGQALVSSELLPAFKETRSGIDAKSLESALTALARVFEQAVPENRQG